MKVTGTFGTKMKLDNITSPPKGRAWWRDTRCPGLYLSVSATGRRGWFAQLKIDGKPKTFKLKPYHKDAEPDDPGVMTLKRAREAVDEARERIQANLEPFPSTDDREFPAVWDRFNDAHLSTLALGTQRNYQTLRNHIGDRWDERLVASIRDDDCDQLLIEIRDSARAQGSNGIASHNNGYSMLKVFFRWCWERRLVDDDWPMARMRMPNKQVERDRVLSESDLAAIWKAAGEENYPYRQLIRFNLLVPVRIWSEAGAIKRDSVDDKQIWRYAVPKTGVKQSLPLPVMAQEILAECPSAGDYFFHGMVSKGSQSQLKSRIDRRCEVEDWRFHDFRTAVMTHLRNLGAPFDLIDEIGRPKKNDSAGARHYDWAELLEDKGELLEYWCYVFRSILAGKVIQKDGPVLRWRDWLRGADVVALERRA